jgi:hypothetical protein
MRKRAERRIGELIEERRKAGKLAKGAREKGTKRGTTRVAEKPTSLADQGIDKNLADRARKLAALSSVVAFVGSRHGGAVAFARGASKFCNDFDGTGFRGGVEDSSCSRSTMVLLLA